MQAKSKAEVIALVGNWRPVKAPPLVEFVRHCLIVEKASGELIPFEPWPAQEEALEMIEQTDKLVVPKGRQVGITWLELAAMLWAGTFFGHRLFPIARQSDEYAREAITRLLILAGYDPTSEPGNLRVLAESPLPKLWRPSDLWQDPPELRLANGSTYRALTATQPIARGLAAYWGLADEYAFWPWPARQLRPWSRAAPGCTWSRPVTAQTMPSRPSMRTPRPAAAPTRRCSSPPMPIHDATRSGIASTSSEAADPDSARREHARSVQDAFRIAEGVFFKKFSFERNVAEVEIMDNWETYRAIDFGLRHAACLWAQSSPQGQLFIVDELLTCDLATAEFAEAIKAHEAPFNLVEPSLVSYCDPAGKAANQQTTKTEFDVFAASRPAALRQELRGARRLCEDHEPAGRRGAAPGDRQPLRGADPGPLTDQAAPRQPRDLRQGPRDLLAPARCPALSARRRRARGGSQTVGWNADASGPFEALERAGRRNLMEGW